MKELYENRVLLMDRPLTVRAFYLGSDLHVSVFGGDQAHIGAVSILSPGGNIQTVRFPGHRDDTVSALWCRRLKESEIRCAVVEVGIHYDALSKAGIAAVLSACDGLWKHFQAAYLSV